VASSLGIALRDGNISLRDYLRIRIPADRKEAIKTFPGWDHHWTWGLDPTRISDTSHPRDISDHRQQTNKVD
jgi:hypothetical protein